MTLTDWIGIGNLIVLAATGWVVWIYTQAAQRSNEIQEQPLLNFLFKENTTNQGGSRLGTLSLKNIGKGPAYNIRIEPITLAGYRYKFYIEETILEPAQEVHPRAAVRTPEGATEAFDRNLMWFLTRLVPQRLNQQAVEHARNNPAIFLARYEGVNGKNYYSVFALYCTLAPVGDILMQFVAHGSDDYSLDQAKEAWKQAKKFGSPFED